MRPPRRLRDQLLWALLAVATVPVVIVSAIHLRNSYATQYAATEKLLESRATAILSRVDGYTQKYADAVEALAGSVVREGAPRPADWSEPVLRYHTVYGGFLTMAVADTEGRVRLAIGHRGKEHVAAAAGGEIADREYFRQALHSASTFVSGVFLGRGLGHDPLVAISHGIRGPSGEVTGIVQGALYLERFRQFAIANEGPDLSGLVIADRHNLVTYATSSTPFHVLEDLSGHELAQVHPPRTFRYADYLVKEADVRSPYGWRVFVFAPAAQLRAIMLEGVLHAFACLLLGGAISMVLARFVAGRITLPLEHLTMRVRTLLADGAARTAAAEVLAASAPAEVRELAEGFAAMTRRLGGSYGALRQLNYELVSRIAERTSDLREMNRELTLRDRAMAATNEGISIADARLPDLPLVYINSGFTRLTGYSPAEVLGRNCRFLQGPLTDRKTVETLRTMLTARQSCTVELRNYRKDGTTFWNRLSITPVTDAEGVVTHFVGVQVDISAHKELERIKNDLISTVSHELRTPLTSLRGFAELMLERQYSPERSRQFLRVIHKESARLTELVNDFLDIQRVEAGRQNFHLEDFTLGPLLEEASQMAAGNLGGHRLDLRLEDPQLCLHADRPRVRQVVDNLLSNARKFSPEGSVITIQARRQGEEAVIAVHDEGIGIPADAIGKLFTRFYRVDNTETRRIGGTGLGLELCKRIVEAQGGRIWVESVEGAGATFFFTLPLAEDTPPLHTDASRFQANALSA